LDGIIAEYLAGASLGTPVSHDSITVFPIFAPQASEEHDYLVMHEALDLGVLQITELSCGVK
jgi:hypothetical protein